jgi:hypothetical protein
MEKKFNGVSKRLVTSKVVQPIVRVRFYFANILLYVEYLHIITIKQDFPMKFFNMIIMII